MFKHYRAVANRLGFTMDPSSPGLLTRFLALSGEYEGRDVRIDRSLNVDSVETQVALWPPLDLGLRLEPTGQPRYPGAIELRFIQRLFAPKDLNVGDTELDDAFAIHADEQVRAGALIAALRTPLLRLHGTQANFEVMDGFVSMRRRSGGLFLEDETYITADLDGLCTLADEIETACALVPAAAALVHHVPAFEALAATYGLTLARTPLSASGTIGGRPFVSWVTRTAPLAFSANTRVELRPALEGTIGLDLPPPDGTAGEMAACEAEVEDRFEAVGEVRTQLTDEARSSLAALRHAGHAIELTNEGVVFRRPLGPEPYPIDAYAALVLAALDALERSSVKQTVYR